MKKKHLMLAMGITLSSIITTSTDAQLMAANVGAAFDGSVSKLEKNVTAKSKEDVDAAKALAKLTKANLRSLKDFKHQFEDGPDVKWNTGNETITASFNRNDVQNWIVYNKKGRWLRDMQAYQENKMPNELRKLVKRAFSSYKVTLVQEIKEPGLLFYIIHLEDDKEYKELCVYEGDYWVIKEYKKQAL